MSVLGIIPARGGSKGIPGKNIVDLAGKPLIYYSISAAMESKVIDHVVVTTDSPDISSVAKQCGADVIMRPTDLATDNSPTLPAIEHVLQTMRERGKVFETVVLLQPTSPLRTAHHISEAIELLTKNQEISSVISVIECEHHPYKSLEISKGRLSALVSNKYLESPRQSLPEAYRPNGALFILKTKTLLDKRSFFVDPILPYVMDRTSSIDIDTTDDLNLCEFYISDKNIHLTHVN